MWATIVAVAQCFKKAKIITQKLLFKGLFFIIVLELQFLKLANVLILILSHIIRNY